MEFAVIMVPSFRRREVGPSVGPRRPLHRLGGRRAGPQSLIRGPPRRGTTPSRSQIHSTEGPQRPAGAAASLRTRSGTSAPRNVDPGWSLVPNDSVPRKLTPRQSAVLAAIERRGSATLLELWTYEFPRLPQSVLARVAERMVERGHLVAEGNSHFIYTGGVRFWPKKARPAVSADLRGVVDRLGGLTGLKSWIESDVGAGCILLPVSEIERHVEGRPWSAFDLIAGEPDGTLDLMQKTIRSYPKDGLEISVEVRVRPTLDDRHRRAPELAVRVGS